MTIEPFVVLFACKVAFLPFSSEIDRENSEFTGHKPYKFEIENSVMHCRRHVIQVYDQAAAQGADAQPFTEYACMKASWQIRMDWDRTHSNTKWRVWRTTCPKPGQSVATIDGPRVNKQERCAVVYDNDIAI